MANSRRLISANIQVSIRIVNSTVSESTDGPTVVRIRVSTLTTKRKGSVFIRGRMVRSIKDTGVMVSKTVSADSKTLRANSVWVAGRMANVLSGSRSRMNRMA